MRSAAASLYPPAHSILRPLSAWQWAALLGFALLAPAGLPAGGAQARGLEVRRRECTDEPLVSPIGVALLCAPQQEAPVLVALEAGLPLTLLRAWRAPNGQRWLRVATRGPGDRARRGWLQQG
jgi:hypothetical protein